MLEWEQIHCESGKNILSSFLHPEKKPRSLIMGFILFLNGQKRRTFSFTHWKPSSWGGYVLGPVTTLGLLSYQNGVKCLLGRMGKGGAGNVLDDRV